MPRKLITPIHFKTRDGRPVDEDASAYLLLASNGLFMCRQHEFFTASVEARSWPSELASHEPSLDLHLPPIPQPMWEQIIGFFGRIAEDHNSEAGVLLAWNRASRQCELIVPPQIATISRSWTGRSWPIGLHYEAPTDLGPDLSIVGSAHSHVFESAYSSGQDKQDEEYRPGLHLVVGRLQREPPELHAEFVVDGHRFDIEAESVIAGYDERNEDVPESWIEQVAIRAYCCGRTIDYPANEADVDDVFDQPDAQSKE
jgi:hypothetical protein